MAPLMSPILNAMSYLNLTPILKPVVKRALDFMYGNQLRDLHDLDRMTETRVIKTHLPFYLLHPKVLDTAKVSFFLPVVVVAVVVVVWLRRRASLWPSS